MMPRWWGLEGVRPPSKNSIGAELWLTTVTSDINARKRGETQRFETPCSKPDKAMETCC